MSYDHINNSSQEIKPQMWRHISASLSCILILVNEDKGSSGKEKPNSWGSQHKPLTKGMSFFFFFE